MATSERRFIIAILFGTAAAGIAGAEGTTTAQAGMRRTKSRLRAAGQQEEWELLLPSTWCRRPGHERLAGATQARLRPAHRDHVRHTANVIQPRVQFNLGIFQNGPGAGFEANKTPDCYRCYTQWAGFTVGNQASYWKYLDQAGIQTFAVGEAESSLVFAYTYDWTKMRPGTPNPKGFAPYPDGLSSTISLEDPTSTPPTVRRAAIRWRVWPVSRFRHCIGRRGTDSRPVHGPGHHCQFPLRGRRVWNGELADCRPSASNLRDRQCRNR